MSKQGETQEINDINDWQSEQSHKRKPTHTFYSLYHCLSNVSAQMGIYF